MGVDLSQLYAIPAFRLFAIVALLLVLKMIAVAFYTTSLRRRRSVYATPEDYQRFGGAPRPTADDDVERARRAHLNDLENVLPFLVVAFLYALTAPNMWAARVYFWGFLIARIFHTIAYLGGLQPHRTIAFTAGMVLLVVMLLHTLVILL